MDEIQAWFAGRLPAEWFTGPADVEHDGQEIYVIGTLEDVALEGGLGDAAVEEARSGRIKRFREDTRKQRMAIADEAEARFGRKVAWGAQIADVRVMFTHLAILVMTRLRLRERKVLDTLVDAGVARSRAHALAWCVRLVAKNQKEWIDELRDALVHVEKVRAEGPVGA
jgi:hypothetical protein